ncbi:substrate-binding domain-containing protein [Candidatus Competibacter phosphatis]|nr:substrate-binding domain-containing protein [Candidatus Competibacter phosphatis]
MLAVPKDRPESQAAKALVHFLGSEQVQAILARYGL